MAVPGFLSGASPKAKTPTVAPTGAPRQVRDGDYITTYAPSGAVLSRVYSPVVRQTQTTNRSEAQVQRTSQANSAQNFINRYQTPAPAQTTKGLFAGNTSSGGGGTLGQVQSAGATSMGSPDTYGGGAIGGSVDPASGSSSTGGAGTQLQNAGSDFHGTGPFKDWSLTQADYGLANPLSIASKVFGIDMTNNPTIASLLSPILEQASNPFAGLMMNPSATTGSDTNSELNFMANMLKEYTKPGGSFFSPTQGINSISQAMGSPDSALNAVLHTGLGEGVGGAGTQFSMLQKLMEPFMALGTGTWGSDIWDAIAYNAYNKYMQGNALGTGLGSNGLPKEDFYTTWLRAMGQPGKTLK